MQNRKLDKAEEAETIRAQRQTGWKTNDQWRDGRNGWMWLTLWKSSKKMVWWHIAAVPQQHWTGRSGCKSLALMDHLTITS